MWPHPGQYAAVRFGKCCHPSFLGSCSDCFALSSHFSAKWNRVEGSRTPCKRSSQLRRRHLPQRLRSEVNQWRFLQHYISWPLTAVEITMYIVKLSLMSLFSPISSLGWRVICGGVFEEVAAIEIKVRDRMDAKWKDIWSRPEGGIGTERCYDGRTEWWKANLVRYDVALSTLRMSFRVTR